MRILVTGGAGLQRILAGVAPTIFGDGEQMRDLDSSRARRTLGWAPAVPVEDGLRSTWEWFATRASGQAEGA